MPGIFRMILDLICIEKTQHPFSQAATKSQLRNILLKFCPATSSWNHNAIYGLFRVTIIDFRKVGQKGLKNEDKV